MAQTSKYAVGDKVVHPQHGAATIVKKVKQEFGGKKMDYFVLEIATEQLTVMVPVDKVEDLIRPVISKTKAREVLRSLKGEPEEAGANWSRWYKVLNEKMTSGDIFQVAEVVRDLTYAQQTKGISPALKRMLSKARMTLISELAFSLQIDEEEATKRLDRALPVVCFSVDRHGQDTPRRRARVGVSMHIGSVGSHPSSWVASSCPRPGVSWRPPTVMSQPTP